MDSNADDNPTAQRLPVDRNYDFESWIRSPEDDVEEYYPQDTEYERVVGTVHMADRLPRFLAGGPTGAGKTLLARWVAATLPWYQSTGPDQAVYYRRDIRALERTHDVELLAAHDDEDIEDVDQWDGTEGDMARAHEDVFFELVDGATDPSTGEPIEFRTGCPIVTIQCKYSMSEADLLGMPNVDGDGTYWQDGPVTKALLASREMPVVLLLDEANRARPESKSALFSVLDDRAELVLDGRGGERVTGIPQHLISFAAINEGAGYYVEEMDYAEKRRLGAKLHVNHLGAERKERAVELLSDRTRAHEDLAAVFIDAANDVRDLAEADHSPVSIGVPTGTVLEWAETAYAYHGIGFDNPLMESAEDVVVRPFYDDHAGESDVREAIAGHVDDVPFDEEAFAEFTADENEQTDDGRPDNSDVSVAGGDVGEIIQEIEDGADPNDLVERPGIEESDVMEALANADLQ